MCIRDRQWVLEPADRSIKTAYQPIRKTRGRPNSKPAGPPRKVVGALAQPSLELLPPLDHRLRLPPHPGPAVPGRPVRRRLTPPQPRRPRPPEQVHANENRPWAARVQRRPLHPRPAGPLSRPSGVAAAHSGRQSDGPGPARGSPARQAYPVLQRPALRPRCEAVQCPGRPAEDPTVTFDRCPHCRAAVIHGTPCCTLCYACGACARCTDVPRRAPTCDLLPGADRRVSGTSLGGCLTTGWQRGLQGCPTARDAPVGAGSSPGERSELISAFARAEGLI